MKTKEELYRDTNRLMEMGGKKPMSWSDYEASLSKLERRGVLLVGGNVVLGLLR